MPVPTLISQLSTTASLNSPDGAVDVPSSIDDYQRAHAAFIAQLRDRTATDLPNTPAGNITATTVQAAINELDSEKAKVGALASSGITGAAASGANADITSLTGLTTALSIAQGGTSATTAAAARAALGGLGIGQTWQDVAASRAINTNYTNTTGLPISVAVSVEGAVASSTLTASMTVGGVAGINRSSMVVGATPGNTTLSTTVIVPPGVVYQCAVTQGTLSSWKELR